MELVVGMLDSLALAVCLVNVALEVVGVETGRIIAVWRRGAFRVGSTILF